MLKLFTKNVGGGLGDQTLDTLGAMVVAKYLQYHKLYIVRKTISQHHNVHGELIFDFALFDIHPDTFEIELLPEEASYEDLKHSCDILHLAQASASSAPRLAIKFLHGKGLNMSLHELINTYKALAKFIKPSKILNSYLLDCGCDIIGIHVRTSDKLTHFSCPVFSNRNEYEHNFNKLVQDVLKDLEANPEAKVFVCGERINDVNNMKDRLKQLNPNVTFIEAPQIPADLINTYKGIHAVQDMFCLSKCKKIYQTVGYSTFSLVASLIGSSELVNYWVGNGPTLLYAYIEEDFPLTAQACDRFSRPELHVNG